MLGLEACAVAVGARRGREGNLVRTLIRPNGWRKVARSAETRQKTVEKAEKEEKKVYQREPYWIVQRGCERHRSVLRDSRRRRASVLCVSTGLVRKERSGK